MRNQGRTCPSGSESSGEGGWVLGIVWVGPGLGLFSEMRMSLIEGFRFYVLGRSDCEELWENLIRVEDLSCPNRLQVYFKYIFIFYWP